MSPQNFRTRFEARDGLIGSFIKSPTYQPTEILGMMGFDFIVIDEEHAPFNRETVDMIILAAKAAGIAPLVRVADIGGILSVIDCGATGVLVPHVKSADIARQAVAACRYQKGSRGFSPSGRAGNYGTVTRHDHITSQDQSIAVLAMIEDPEALDVIDDIMAVDDLTGVFIGRGDLTTAFGASSPKDAVVTQAVATILAAAKRHNKPACMMVENAGLAADFASQGATAFIIGSDQSLLKRGAKAASAEYAAFFSTHP